MINRKIIILMVVLFSIAFASFAEGKAEEKGAEVKVEKQDRFFNITLIVPIGNSPREKAGQIIARDLEKIGIGVNLRYMEAAAISPRWKLTAQTGAPFEEGGYDLYIIHSTLDSTIDPSGIYQRFASDQHHPDGKNRVAYNNLEFDKLIYQALEEEDDQERYKLVREAMVVVYDDLPTIPMWRPSQFYGIRSDVKFPEGKSPINWQSYALRWASREIDGKSKEDMSLRERTLVYAQPSDVDAFLLGYSGSGYTDRAVGYMAYDSLIQRVYPSLTTGSESERGLRSSMASDWNVSEDGKIWTVNLREDVTWHDGKPFTADDVIFSYDLMTNPEAGYKGPSKFIKQVGMTWEKIDKYTVRFVSEKFSPLFASSIMGRHVLPKHLLEDIPLTDLVKSDYNTGKLVSAGPFILDEYKPGEYIKYRANENYFNGRPWFDYVVIRIIPEGTTAWYALQTGAVDITGKWYGFTRELEEAKADPNIYALLEPSFGSQMIRVNNEHPILGNVLVKKAISLACNRQVMVDVVSGGLGVVANQHLPPWSPGHNPALPPLEYDLEEAKRMLIEAGYDYDTITVKGPSK